MAQYGRSLEGFSASRTIRITSSDTTESYTVYTIEVTVGQWKWTVKHRYSEFHDLHEKLVSQYKLNKGLLPPKKLFGNQSEVFIKKRQGELEIYLQTVLHYLPIVPHELALFLDFHKYEIHGLTEVLAEDLYHGGELILQAGETFHTSPLQLHAVSVRLKLAEPTCDSGDTKKDLGHVLDFITRLKYLKVQGGNGKVGTSNIELNQLPFGFNSFKAIEALEIYNCNAHMISDLDSVKKTLKKLRVHHTVKSLKEILLGETSQWRGWEASVLLQAWVTLVSTNFSHNSITAIDESVKLMPRVEVLDLSENQLSGVDHLQYLSCLQQLNLSHNHIHRLEAMHTRLGNVKILNLAGNKLESLQGLSKLYSLETLDVSYNDISQVLEVRYISGLPCLEKLNLICNPVTIVLDYRTKVLEMFAERASEVSLDGERATQKELDTVAVLLAIQKSKQSKAQGRMRRHTHEAEIADSANGASGASAAATSSEGVGTPVVPSTATSNSIQVLESHNPEQYRSQMEAFRAQAGESWLTLLNDLQDRNSREQNEDSDLEEAVAVDPADDVARQLTLEEQEEYVPPRPRQFLWPEQKVLKVDVQRLENLLTQQLEGSEEEDSEDSDNSDTLPDHIGALCQLEETDLQPVTTAVPSCSTRDQSKEQTRVAILPEILPDVCNSAFVHYLEQLMPDTQAMKQILGLGNEGHEASGTKEKPVSLLWCNVACYTKPQQEIPACVYLSTHNLHLFCVKNVNMKSNRHSDPHVELEHIYCIPYLNIQQVVIGYQSKFVRIEEAFVGPQGTYTLLSSSSNKTEHFIEVLKDAFQQNIHFGEAMDNELPVAVAADGELLLKQALNKIEGFGSSSQVQIKLYDLVYEAVISGKKGSRTRSLVLTNKYMYLLKEDYMHCPKPTFAFSPSVWPQYEIMVAVPIQGNIGQIEQYNSLHARPGQGHTTSQDKEHKVQFCAYGVVIHLQKPTQVYSSNSQASQLDIQCTSRESQQCLVGHLMQMYTPDLVYDNANGGNSPATDTFSEEVIGASGIPLAATRGQSGLPAGGTASGTAENKNATPHVSQAIRTTKTPNTLDLRYPSMDLITLLTRCNEGFQLMLLKPLSAQMHHLASMTGDELLNFFHSQIAQIGVESEELRYILWICVVPYLSPLQEIVTCVMLSTKAMYFVSDEVPQGKRVSKSQHWKTHTRNKSDSLICKPQKKSNVHHSAGILNIGTEGAAANILRPYTVIQLRDLKQVKVGLFDQKFRLAGQDGSQVLSCITRDHSLTEAFIKQLMGVLSLNVPTPSPEIHADSEQDFYSMFSRRCNSEVLEFVHPSKVKFIYPSEDSVSDLTYLIVENMRGKKIAEETVNVLLYLLVFQIDSTTDEAEVALSKGKARTLILSATHICLAVEDHVSYPLPDFVRSLPDNQHYEIKEIRNLEYLRRVVVSDFLSHDVTLIFADENEDIIVDVNLDHYSAADPMACRGPTPEVRWTLVIQSQRDKDRLIKLLSQRWSEIHEGEDLSIQVST